MYTDKLEISKYYKRIEDGTQGLHTMKINCKVFAIPILTAIVSIIINAHAIRIRIANALELTFMP